MQEHFTEREVIVAGEYQLSATLTIPKEHDVTTKYPAIVIVSGSGGADRDGNIKSLPSNTYKHLASFLTSIGFVTIRYDKRGIGQSQGDPYSTGMKDLVDDVISNVKYLQSLPEVSQEQILLLGHSEGTILSTVANTQYPVAGLILIAGAGSSLRTAMEWQNSSVAAEIEEMQGIKGAILRRLVTKEKVNQKQNALFNKILASDEEVMKIQLKKFPAKWMREHLQYTDEDLLNMLEETACPILAVTGDKDVQANPADLERVRALGKENIICSIIANMDHLLREYEGKKTILHLKKQYKGNVDKPLHPQLKEQMKVWLFRHIINDRIASI